MGVLKITGFAGMWPVRDPRALPDNAAVDAVNTRVDGGAYLKGVSGNTLIKALAAATKSVFRIPLSGENTLANSFWMEFADENTDVVRAPIVNDQYERIYWASPSTGLKYAPRASIIAGAVGFQSGVVAPSTGPTVTPVAGTGAMQNGVNTAPRVTRAYAVTFISVYGEESQPGPSIEAIGHTDQDWLITAIAQPGSPGARAAYQSIRLYRTVTAASGATNFYKVADIPVGTTFYMDRLSDTTVTGQTELQTTLWAPPPEGLQGLVSMPNGIFVSWKDNNLYFSENYRPHAWPAEYMMTVDYPIVGSGVFGNTCVVATTGNPFMVSGVKSNAMSLVKVGEAMPCLSRRSIVSMPDAVMWATERGLAVASSAGVSVVTAGFISREDWIGSYSPVTQKAALIEGAYVAARAPLAPDTSDGFSFNPVDPSKLGVAKFSFVQNVKSLGFEPWTGKPWLIGSDNNLYQMQTPGAAPLSYTWKSKEYTYPVPTNFAVSQAFFDDNAGGSLGVKVWVTLRGNDGVVMKTLVHNHAYTRSGQEVRLPSGFKSDVWEFEFSGTVDLQSFLMASSVSELRRV